MESSTANIEVLLRSLSKTDSQEAFSQLYRIYFEKLSRYIYTLCSDKYQSEEIAQETLLILWKNRKKIKAHTSLNAYLYRSAYNNYINLYNKNKKRAEHIEEFRLNTIIALEELDTKPIDKRLDQLQKIINDLPPIRKEIFILNKLQNYTYKEIAKMRNISERTVESQIRKALITIRAAIKDLNLPLLILHFLLDDTFF